jgi:ABC-2 type transport system ATP-binding protein
MNEARKVVARLDNVTKRYGNTVALDGVSVDVMEGGVVAMLGPNGAGKTTSIRLLLGLSTPTNGSAFVFGGDPHKSENRRRIGAMLQVGKVPETLKVREHLDLFRSYYPNPLSMDETIELGGLAGIENRKFGDLSGGQKQRVLFALALCGDPELLFLDEPTLGFDVEVRRAFWKQIRAYIARGRTILLTTHYLEEADALADRIVVIDHGSIVADGTPAEIKSRADGRRVRCTTTVSVDEIRRMRGVASVVSDGERVEIITSLPEQNVKELLNRDESLSNLEVASVGLEDAFMKLVSRENTA